MGMKVESSLLFFTLSVAVSVALPSPGSSHVAGSHTQLELALSVKTMDRITRLNSPVSFCHLFTFTYFLSIVCHLGSICAFGECMSTVE